MLQKIDLEKKLEEIEKVLEQKYLEDSHLGVLAGLSGISLFFFYYAKYKQDNRPAEIGSSILEESLSRISEGYTFSTYCSGIAGLGWVFEHLSENDLIDVDNDQLLPDLEDYLYIKMTQDINACHYDFLHGAIGYGLYFLKRFKNTQSPDLKKKYQSYIQELINGLKKISEEDEHGIKWSSEINKTEIKPKTVYNLSLSHGISSITNFLARAYEFPEFRQQSLPLLKGSVSYILAQEKVIGQSLYPSVVPKDSEDEQTQARLSWCYGDLGVGMSLYKASQVLKDSNLKEHAIRILLHTTNRKELKSCGIVDASPCHGAFGLAQIYGTVFNQTQIKEFKSACDYWMAAGLNLAIYEDGYAGYKQHKHNQPRTNEVSLLEGIAGIGLCIISYLSDFEPNWEESLMIK
ncbi:lanthionine synthetase C family protein [Roseivirga echinicomitans]|uniref:Lantibiotic biosynthesis protein n=1 Tax=Roseivirga echinicomitans TaxID=296218 RepID=A0A150XLN3_9BACT|nr:lanthionine synthetase C family protein [Roseivirga echinicomitans]KYG79636.1 hypothetical protein AWN68_17685 [Roseivirga echinicomitans]